MSPRACTTIALALPLLCLGCRMGKPDADSPEQGAKERDNQANGGAEVLAEVNGETITAADLEFGIERTLGKRAQGHIDAEQRKRLLQSLVRTRAMAQARDKQLTDAERDQLERHVAAYREELLVKQYLSRNATLKRITDEEVERYYKEHPELFGGVEERSWQLLASERALEGRARDQLLKALTSAGDQRDWEQLASRLSKKGPAVVLHRGDGEMTAFASKLRQLVRGLGAGESSKPILVDGRVYVARVTEVRALQPRPLSEVSAEIRKSLAPREIGDAVAEVSKRVLAQAKVSYR
ncbi:MAG: peptidylprolyl isomerase [Myxococcales bacterium]|nr:peptidylprolyl isomerase [Myxococcales bacterium]